MKNKIASKNFRVTPGDKVNLKQWPTGVKPFCESKKRYKKLLKEQVEALSSLQRLHYASKGYALLLIFQAMDAARKDGAIRHVMSGVNPQGCQVFSFKQPSPEELDPDCFGARPAVCWSVGGSASSIGPITKRSSSFACIRSSSRPGAARRAAQCRDYLERALPFHRGPRGASSSQRNAGHQILPFTCRRTNNESASSLALMSRTRIGSSAFADVQERKHWKGYMKAYEDCLGATSTPHAAWHVVPADDKQKSPLIVSQIVLDTFHELKMAYPKTPEKRRGN